MKTIQDITDFIFLEDTPKACNIILIPGSLQWEHVEKAAEMYKAGYAKFIVPCGGYSYTHGRFMWEKLIETPYEGKYETEAEYMKTVLLKNGVDEDHIVCEDRSTNTFENAIFARKLLDDKKIKHDSMMLCCQAYHARRAFMTFERYFMENAITVIPTATLNITRENWYRNKDSFKMVMSELEKCGAFFNDMYTLIPGNDD